jgi:hypothetical protein
MCIQDDGWTAAILAIAPRTLLALHQHARVHWAGGGSSLARAAYSQLCLRVSMERTSQGREVTFYRLPVSNCCAGVLAALLHKSLPFSDAEPPGRHQAPSGAWRPGYGSPECLPAPRNVCLARSA